jgi:exonuclease III
MKIITWNIRGLNNPRKKRILKNRLRKEQPDLCFIQETKCIVDIMETISKKQWRKFQMLDVEGQQMAGRYTHLMEPHIHLTY